jgi:hypothetical protein
MCRHVGADISATPAPRRAAPRCTALHRTAGAGGGRAERAGGNMPAGNRDDLRLASELLNRHGQGAAALLIEGPVVRAVRRRDMREFLAWMGVLDALAEIAAPRTHETVH